MIILDGEADGQTKEDTYNGLTLRHPQAAFTRSTSPLPDYDTSEAQHWKAIAEPPVRWKVDPRFWKAGLYALAIYVLLSILIVIPILVWVCLFFITHVKPVIEFFFVIENTERITPYLYFLDAWAHTIALGR